MYTANLFKPIVLILVSLTLIACGNSSGGSGNPGNISTLVNGSFTKTTGAIVPSGFSGLIDATSYRHFQYLYKATEIKGSGYIKAISFGYSVDQVLDVTCPNFSIKMGHTSLPDLTNTFANNIQEGKGTLQTVLNSTTVTFPAGHTDDKHTLILDVPFYYNGIDGLVVEVERGSSCSGTFYDKATTGIPYTSILQTNVMGSLTGTNLNYYSNLEFEFSGGEDAVVFTNNPGWLAVPLTTISSLRKSQFLYTKDQINGSGPITGIAFPIGGMPSTNEEYTLTVKLGHSTLNDLGSTFAANYSDAPATVANNIILKVPAGLPVGSDLWIPMPDGNFIYNGIDNLIVEIDIISTTGNTFWKVHSGANMTRLLGSSGAATGSMDTVVNDIKFRFYGGSIDVITDDGDSTGLFFNNVLNPTRQSLYLATELGSSGLINKIACRMSSASSAAGSFPNFVITMGHSDVSTLSPTYADNYLDSMVVYNGTYILPGSYIRGDWIEFPVTPFAYNGVNNLVVRVESDAGTSNRCFLSSPDAIRYPAHSVGDADRTLLTGATIDNRKVDMRFWITR